MLTITTAQGTTYWHTGTPLPDVVGRQVTFIADGDELDVFLAAMRATRSSAPASPPAPTLAGMAYPDTLALGSPRGRRLLAPITIDTTTDITGPIMWGVTDDGALWSRRLAGSQWSDWQREVAP